MKNFKTEFSEYKVLITDDNTPTLYSSFYDENCHSMAGAKSETLHNYIHGCQLERFHLPREERDINILEVGFGLGVGLLSTLDYLKNVTFQKKLHFVSLEIDKGLVEYFLQINSLQYPFLDKLDFRQENGLQYYLYNDSSVKILILIGDAKETLKKSIGNILKDKFHAIYQDAFSPKKNPELWTTEWFETLKNVSFEETILSTYSAAGNVKKALTAAGFSIENVKGYHLKKNITIAKLNSEA